MVLDTAIMVLDTVLTVLDAARSVFNTVGKWFEDHVLAILGWVLLVFTLIYL